MDDKGPTSSYSFATLKKPLEGCPLESGSACLVKRISWNEKDEHGTFPRRYSTKADVLREIWALQALRQDVAAASCPHLLKMEFFPGKVDIDPVVCFEYCQLSARDLWQKLTGRLREIELAPIRVIGFSVLSALKILHSLGIVHGNVRPQNIMLQRVTLTGLPPVSGERYLCKLGEVGAPPPVPDEAHFLHSNEPLCFHSDLYALVICLLVLGRSASSSDISKKCINQPDSVDHPLFPSKKELTDVVTRVVNNSDITIETILNHEFFSSLGNAASLSQQLVWIKAESANSSGRSSLTSSDASQAEKDSWWQSKLDIDSINGSLEYSGVNDQSGVKTEVRTLADGQFVVRSFHLEKIHQWSSPLRNSLSDGSNFADHPTFVHRTNSDVQKGLREAQEAHETSNFQIIENMTFEFHVYVLIYSYLCRACYGLAIDGYKKCKEEWPHRFEWKEGAVEGVLALFESNVSVYLTRSTEANVSRNKLKAEDWQKMVDKLKNAADSQASLVKIRMASFNPRPLIIFDYVQGGTLFDVLVSSSYTVDFELAKKWIVELWSGLQALHEKRIVHGSLTPSNVRISGLNEGNNASLLIYGYEWNSIMDLVSQQDKEKSVLYGLHAGGEGMISWAASKMDLLFLAPERDVQYESEEQLASVFKSESTEEGDIYSAALCTLAMLLRARYPTSDAIASLFPPDDSNALLLDAKEIRDVVKKGPSIVKEGSGYVDVPLKTQLKKLLSKKPEDRNPSLSRNQSVKSILDDLRVAWESDWKSEWETERIHELAARKEKIMGKFSSLKEKLLRQDVTLASVQTFYDSGVSVPLECKKSDHVGKWLGNQSSAGVRKLIITPKRETALLGPSKQRKLIDTKSSAYRPVGTDWFSPLSEDTIFNFYCLPSNTTSRQATAPEATNVKGKQKIARPNSHVDHGRRLLSRPMPFAVRKLGSRNKKEQREKLLEFMCLMGHMTHSNVLWAYAVDMENHEMLCPAHSPLRGQIVHFAKDSQACTIAMMDLARGLEFLHHFGIAHRNLRPESVVVALPYGYDSDWEQHWRQARGRLMLSEIDLSEPTRVTGSTTANAVADANFASFRDKLFPGDKLPPGDLQLNLSKIGGEFFKLLSPPPLPPPLPPKVLEALVRVSMQRIAAENVLSPFALRLRDEGELAKEISRLLQFLPPESWQRMLELSFLLYRKRCDEAGQNASIGRTDVQFAHSLAQTIRKLGRKRFQEMVKAIGQDGKSKSISHDLFRAESWKRFSLVGLQALFAVILAHFPTVFQLDVEVGDLCSIDLKGLTPFDLCKELRERSSTTADLVPPLMDAHNLFRDPQRGRVEIHDPKRGDIFALGLLTRCLFLGNLEPPLELFIHGIDSRKRACRLPMVDPSSSLSRLTARCCSENGNNRPSASDIASELWDSVQNSQKLTMTPIEAERQWRVDCKLPFPEKSNAVEKNWPWYPKVCLEFYGGDMSLLPVDLLVVASGRNNTRPHDAAIANAVHSAAGPQLETDCIAKYFETALTTGESESARLLASSDPKIFSGYDALARYVLFTVGPDRKMKRDGKDLLVSDKYQQAKEAYTKALEKADEMPDVTSVALPLIGSGNNGVFINLIDVACKACLESIREYFDPNARKKVKVGRLDRVIVCLFKPTGEMGRQMYNEKARAMRKLLVDSNYLHKGFNESEREREKFALPSVTNIQFNGSGAARRQRKLKQTKLKLDDIQFLPPQLPLPEDLRSPLALFQMYLTRCLGHMFEGLCNGNLLLETLDLPADESLGYFQAGMKLTFVVLLEAVKEAVPSASTLAETGGKTGGLLSRLVRNEAKEGFFEFVPDFSWLFKETVSASKMAQQVTNMLTTALADPVSRLLCSPAPQTVSTSQTPYPVVFAHYIYLLIFKVIKRQPENQLALPSYQGSNAEATWEKLKYWLIASVLGLGKGHNDRCKSKTTDSKWKEEEKKTDSMTTRGRKAIAKKKPGEGKTVKTGRRKLQLCDNSMTKCSELLKAGGLLCVDSENRIKFGSLGKVETDAQLNGFVVLDESIAEHVLTLRNLKKVDSSSTFKVPALKREILKARGFKENTLFKKVDSPAASIGLASLPSLSSPSAPPPKRRNSGKEKERKSRKSKKL